MTVYVIVQLKMTDRAAYDRYQARFFDVFKKFSGRLLSAAFLAISAKVKSYPGVDLQLAVTLLALLFLLGPVILWFLPETKGRPLPQ